MLLVYSVSCKKISKTDTSGNTPQPIDTTKTDTTKHTPVDLTTKVTSSVSGFVETTQGAAGPLAGVTISFGNKSTITDEFGYFEIKDASVIKEAAQLTASINGYYTHYKTFIASEGKGLFTRMKMDYRFGAGGFASAGGGNFEGGDGERIIIPGNALINEATNTPYAGNVSVSETRIDWDNEDISFLEPGDSRGLDSSGYLKLLTTYGIGNFLLSGTNGENLQLLHGDSATISIPLFGSGQPQSIPL